MVNQTEVSTWDAEFNAMLNQFANGSPAISVQSQHRICADWQERKYTIIEDTHYTYDRIGEVTTDIIRTTICNYIRKWIEILTREYQQVQMQMQSRSCNPGGFDYRTSTMNPGASSLGYSPVIDRAAMPPDKTPPRGKNVEVSNDRPANLQSNVPTIREQPIRETFKEPVLTHYPNTVFPEKQYSSQLGTIQIAEYVSAVSSRPIIHADITLSRVCDDVLDAYVKAMKLFPKPSVMHHIDVTYSRHAKVEVSCDKFTEIFEKIKKVVSENVYKDSLQFVSEILKIINNESRGVADAIDAFLTNEFNRIGEIILQKDTKQGTSVFSIANLAELACCLDTTSTNQEHLQWQELPAFKTQMLRIANATIRNIIMNSVILDPHNPESWKQLCCISAGVSMCDSKVITSNLDVPIKEYVEMSDQERHSRWPEYTDFIYNNTFIVIPNQNLTITNIAQPGTLYKIDDGYSVHMTYQIYSCYDEQHKPTGIESLFEYFLKKYSFVDSDIVARDFIINTERTMALKRGGVDLYNDIRIEP